MRSKISIKTIGIDPSPMVPIYALEQHLSIYTTFDPPWFSLDNTFKGSVQQKPRWVNSDVNRSVGALGMVLAILL